MTTITIPRNLKKEEDLVILPRAEYEALLVEKSDQFRVKRDASFKVPKKQLLEQIISIGFNTLPMVILMTTFSGMVI